MENNEIDGTELLDNLKKFFDYKFLKEIFSKEKLLISGNSNTDKSYNMTTNIIMCMNRDPESDPNSDGVPIRESIPLPDPGTDIHTDRIDGQLPYEHSHTTEQASDAEGSSIDDAVHPSPPSEGEVPTMQTHGTSTELSENLRSKGLNSADLTYEKLKEEREAVRRERRDRQAEKYIKDIIKENKRVVKEYAAENNITPRQAWYGLMVEGEINTEGQKTDPKTTREKWCELTKADPEPCTHTSAISGCAHWEYNTNKDIPASCSHSTFDPESLYCQSTEFGSSSEDELTRPPRYPESGSSSPFDENPPSDD